MEVLRTHPGSCAPWVEGGRQPREAAAVTQPDDGPAGLGCETWGLPFKAELRGRPSGRVQRCRKGRGLRALAKGLEGQCCRCPVQRLQVEPAEGRDRRVSGDRC